MREHGSDKVIWRCDCGKKYKSELAQVLCEKRKHEELKVIVLTTEDFKQYNGNLEPPTIIFKREDSFFDKDFTCIVCGVTKKVLNRKGPIPKRCENCKYKKPGKTKKIAAKSVNRKFVCIDCKKQFIQAEGRGPLPKRCDNCKVVHIEKYNEIIKKRYRERVSQNKCVACGENEPTNGLICDPCKERRKLAKT